ncbi:MAG: hypothetical protein ACFCVE_02445 [Phycisphaerae bacterium]
MNVSETEFLKLQIARSKQGMTRATDRAKREATGAARALRPQPHVRHHPYTSLLAAAGLGAATAYASLPSRGANVDKRLRLLRDIAQARERAERETRKESGTTAGNQAVAFAKRFIVPLLARQASTYLTSLASGNNADAAANAHADAAANRHAASHEDAFGAYRDPGQAPGTPA